MCNFQTRDRLFQTESKFGRSKLAVDLELPRLMMLKWMIVL